MSKGILIFARNNTQIDYIKQAYELALRSQEFLELPVTVVTDSPDYLKEKYKDWKIVFDKVIPIDWGNNDSSTEIAYISKEYRNKKRYNDGSLTKKHLEFKNEIRTQAYDITPYEETIILDTDYIICNNILLNCFEQRNNFLIYKDAHDLSGFRERKEFEKISDTGPDFYWATCVFFRKTQENKIFFDLLKHIHENYSHYLSIFQIPSSVYRNDHAFSIAIHIMNGYSKGDFAGKMPGTLYYTTDKDILIDLTKNSLEFLIEKENYLGEYTLIRTKDINVHCMNKFSLNRILDKE